MMTKHQLTRWLMREVHGIDIGRKPAKKATHLSGSRKPARDWRYRAWIRSLPCAVCSIEPAGEAAHTGRDGGMRQKASDYSCIPLCPDCHRCGPAAYHRIGRLEFQRRHELDIAALVDRLRWVWFNRGKRAA